MRLAGVVLLAPIAALSAALDGGLQPSAQAQSTSGTVQVAAAKSAKKKAPAAKTPAAKKKDAAPQATSRTYAGMPLAERIGIQFDLAWTGHYNGLIDGEFNDRSIAAVKAFQKDYHIRETGVLAAPDRALLASASKTRQERVGWRMVEDKVTGAQVGLPTAQVPNTSPGRSGTRWFSAQGQVQIETFRIREPGATLANVFEQQKKDPPGRKLEVNLLRNDFFILSGMQGLKKFYVRAEIRDLEVRGLTVLYDQATEGIMDPVTVVMSSAFAPFPGSGLAALGPAPRRKVEYATGIVVTAAGHILTDRQFAEDCNLIEVSGYGHANRAAEDSTSGLALLRVYGAENLAPAALVHAGARGGDYTLVGIADPQSQGGGHAVSTANAKLNGEGLQPPPQIGFAGAAAIDGQGRFAGMVALKSPVVASAGAASAPPPQATVVPVETIRRFLDGQYVTPATGPAGAEAMKASLVRVICVRK